MKNIIKIISILAVIFLIVTFGLLIIKKEKIYAPVNNDVSIDEPFGSVEMMEIRAYFGNSRLNPAADCEKAFPVARRVTKTIEVGRVSLEQLLAGVTAREKKDDYFTNIPEGVKINSLKIENQTAFVDFSEELEGGAGGSCRVLAIRRQIEATLRQFPTVDRVIISIDGRTEDILQP